MRRFGTLLATVAVFALASIAAAVDPRFYLSTIDSTPPQSNEAPGSGLTWDILEGTTTVASNTDTQGWVVSYDVLLNLFTVTPAWNKPVGSTYKLRYAATTGNKSMNFDVAAKIKANVLASFVTYDQTAPPSGMAWQITKNGVQVATDTSPNGWEAGYTVSGNYPKVKPPLTVWGDDFELFVDTPIGPRSMKFASIPPSINDAWTRRPAWADASRPLDSTGAPGDGPSAGVAVDGSSGVMSYLPSPDLKVYNRLGPSVSFVRGYQTGMAYLGEAGLGMARGWYDGYDFKFSASTTAWGTVTLRHPNGATETYAPVLDSGTGEPTGAFSHVSGVPYVLTGVPTTSGTPGIWTSLTLHYKDLSKWTFQSFSTAGTYRLATITDINNRSVTFNRPTNDLIDTISNSAGTLMEFEYVNGMITEVKDMVTSRRVVLTYELRYTYSVPTKVSEVGALSGTLPDRYQFQYAGVASTPHLSQVRMRDPSSPSTFVTMSLTYEFYNGRIRNLTDATGRKRIYTYGPTTTHIRANTLSGTEEESWRQRHSLGLSTGFIDGLNNTFYVAASSTAPMMPGTVTNRNGDAVTLTYDGFSNVETVTNLRGVTTTFTYDYSISPLGLCTQIETDGMIPTQFEYHTSGLLHRIKTPVPGMTSGSPQVSEEFLYNGDGSIAVHKVLRSWNPTPTTQTNELVSYTFDYDASGDYPYLPIRITDPLGYHVDAVYNAQGKVTRTLDERGAFTDYEYNAHGQLKLVKEPTVFSLVSSYNGVYTTEFSYDQNGGGRLLSVKKYDAQGVLKHAEYKTLYNEGAYKANTGSNSISGQVNLDGVWNQSGYVDGNSNTTSFAYDAAGNMTTLSRPTGPGLTVTYDAEGNVTGLVNGRSQTTTYSLATDDGRVTGWTNPDETVGIDHDDYGRVLEVSDNAGHRAYTYDSMGNVLAVETEFTGLTGSYSIEYEYNADGSRLVMETPAGKHHYRYDKKGQLIAVDTSTVTGGAPWVSANAAYEYHENGLLEWSHGSKFASHYSYNGRQQLSLATTYDGTETNVRQSFTKLNYNVLGSLDSMTVIQAGVNNTNQTLGGDFTISRDSKFQVLEEKRTWSKPVPTTLYDNVYTRDGNGNVTSMTDKSLSLFTSETYNSNNQRQSSGNAHDDDGNMTQLDGRSVVYDSSNRVVQADGIRHQWNSEGLRAWKDYGSTFQSRQYYLYDGDLVVCEIGGANTTVTIGTVYNGYAYGANGLIACSKKGGSTSVFSFDPFGSPTFRQSTGAAAPSHYIAYDVQGRNHIHNQVSNGNEAALDQDSIGAFAQFGKFTDEQTAFQQDAAGARLKAQTMNTGSLYDPKTGRWAGRYGAIGNGYTPDGHLRLELALQKLGSNLAKWETWSQPIHDGLDVAGMAPALGAIPDVLNGAFYMAEGNHGLAALSFASAVPALGDALGGAKIAAKIALAKATGSAIVGAGGAVGYATHSWQKFAGRFGEVYTLMDGDNVAYVGRTFWPAARKWKHSVTDKFVTFEYQKYAGNLNYAEQRGAEQILIDHFRPAYNIAPGLGLNNKNYNFYMQEGAAALRRQGKYP